MKYRLIVCCICFSLGMSLTYGETNFGLKGGAGIREMVSFGDGFMSPKIGGGGGLFVRSKFVEVFALQMEMLYLLKGAKSSSTIKGIDANDGQGVWDTAQTRTTTIHSFDVPLLLKFYAPGYTNASPNILIGPYYSYMMSREAVLGRSVTQGSKVNPGEDKEAIIGEDRKHDWGMVFGLGIDFGLGTFDIRGSMSMNPIETEGEEEDYHTVNLHVMMGFLITY